MRFVLEFRGAEGGTDVAATAAYEGPGAPAGTGTEETAGGAETTTAGGTGPWEQPELQPGPEMMLRREVRRPLCG